MTTPLPRGAYEAPPTGECEKCGESKVQLAGQKPRFTPTSQQVGFLSPRLEPALGCLGPSTRPPAALLLVFYEFHGPSARSPNKLTPWFTLRGVSAAPHRAATGRCFLCAAPMAVGGGVCVASPGEAPVPPSKPASSQSSRTARTHQSCRSWSGGGCVWCGGTRYLFAAAPRRRTGIKIPRGTRCLWGGKFGPSQAKACTARGSGRPAPPSQPLPRLAVVCRGLRLKPVGPGRP